MERKEEVEEAVGRNWKERGRMSRKIKFRRENKEVHEVCTHSGGTD
jgi:hypothetical protein